MYEIVANFKQSLGNFFSFGNFLKASKNFKFWKRVEEWDIFYWCLLFRQSEGSSDTFWELWNERSLLYTDMGADYTRSPGKLVLELLKELFIVSVRSDDHRVVEGSLHFLFVDVARLPRFVVDFLQISFLFNTQ